MDDIISFNSIGEYNAFNNLETLHPLVSVVHSSKSISEIAYDLGFKYPQHFTRLFKQKVGVSPNEYRSMN